MEINILKPYLKANQSLIGTATVLVLLTTVFSQLIFPLSVWACWQANPDLVIDKTVRNLTAGENNFSNSATAKQGDKLMFQIKVNNSSDTDLKNVFVRDVLPPHLSYVSGSTKVDGAVVADGITTGGINTGVLKEDTNRTITFEVIVEIAGLTECQTLINQAYAKADKVQEKSDTTQISVCPPPPANPDLSIDKKMKNLTNQDPNWNETTNANPRHQLAVQIIVRNSGAGAAKNVQVSDVLPDWLIYTAGSTKVDGVLAPDGITANGLALGDLLANQSKTIYFEVKVEREVKFPRGITNLTNIAKVKAENAAEIQDTAQVVIYYSGCLPEKNSPPAR